MSPTKNKWPGIILCTFIAAIAWFLGERFPLIGSPVFGILGGLFLAMTPLHRKQEFYREGAAFASKKLLQGAVILLGFQMNLFHILEVGSRSILLILFTLAAAFVTAAIVGKLLGTEKNMTILIGVGTAICGGSAIAAAAPVIKAEDDQIAHAISTIFLYNIGAVFLFPALGHLLGMTDAGFGMFAGTAINDTSSVVAAASAWSQSAGNNEALALATIVKLTRTLMIIPITLVLSFLMSKARKEEGGEGAGNLSVVLRSFPWFVLGFLAASIIQPFLPIPEMAHWLATAGKFFIVMAMAAIGWNTNLVKLLTNGFRPILLGLCCWFAVSVTSIVLQNILHLW